MKKKLILPLLCLLALPVLAQAQVAKKIDKNTATLNALKSTDFYKKFDELKGRIETSVAQFHSDMKTRNYSPGDVEEIASAYDNVASKFDEILTRLNKDITGASKKNEFLKHPEKFASGYIPSLQRAYDSFKNGCQLKMDRLSGGGRGRAFEMDEVDALLESAESFSKAIEQNKSRLSKMDADFFERNFIQDLRLKRWEEY